MECVSRHVLGASLEKVSVVGVVIPRPRPLPRPILDLLTKLGIFCMRLLVYNLGKEI